MFDNKIYYCLSYKMDWDTNSPRFIQRGRRDGVPSIALQYHAVVSSPGLYSVLQRGLRPVVQRGLRPVVQMGLRPVVQMGLRPVVHAI